jgi:ribonuclease Z
MLLVCETRRVLIDCGSNPILRLKKVGLRPDDLTDLILTHFHPDHVAGVPQLLMNLWLMGRRQPLIIHGLGYTLDRVDNLMSSFGWSKWPGVFPVEYHHLPALEKEIVLSSNEIRVFSSPVRHLIPCIALRFEFTQNGRTLVFSSDTEPCPEVVRLAEGANILIHEASGELEGHSSATQAGEVASKAKVDQLILIHYPTGSDNYYNLVKEASNGFQGQVIIAEDFMEMVIN